MQGRESTSVILSEINSPKINTNIIENIGLSTDDAQKIIESLQQLTHEMCDFKNIYTYACNFERKKEIKKLATCFKDALNKNRDLWGRAGIVYVDKEISEEKFPADKICIQKVVEGNGISFLKICYKSLGGFTFCFDINELTKKFSLIKENKLTYVAQASQIFKDFDSITHRAQGQFYLPNLEIIKNWRKFIENWPMLKGDIDFERLSLKISDKYDLITGCQGMSYEHLIALQPALSPVFAPIKEVEQPGLKFGK